MIKLYSYGKINLFLDIEGRQPNGYHLIKTVMQSIELHDEIFIDFIENDKIIIECSNPSIPVNEKNTCFNAAALIKEKYHIKTGVIIKINKTIPTEAGLAGGSSNSAAVIRGLNILWNLNLTQGEMLEIGLKVGADVPFCLLGGTYLAEGIGDKLTELNDFVWNYILIVKPNFSMSTAFVYNNLSADLYNSYMNDEIISYINTGDFIEAAKSTSNTLEKVVEKFYPELNSIKDLMIQNKALSSMMTGSGSAVFGLFKDNESLELAFKKISSVYPQTFKTKTSRTGIQIFV
ncbi:MAG: 4-(cytidine 5'-diphospho)-2-C-methyl-D-erythritol kinase [Sedimentibacter sp.]